MNCRRALEIFKANETIFYPCHIDDVLFVRTLVGSIGDIEGSPTFASGRLSVVADSDSEAVSVKSLC